MQVIFFFFFFSLPTRDDQLVHFIRYVYMHRQSTVHNVGIYHNRLLYTHNCPILRLLAGRKGLVDVALQAAFFFVLYCTLPEGRAQKVLVILVYIYKMRARHMYEQLHRTRVYRSFFFFFFLLTYLGGTKLNL